MKKRIPYLIISAVSFASGISLLFLPPSFSAVRGTAGDFLVVIFIYSSVKVLFPMLRPVSSAAGVMALAVSVELLQMHVVKQYFNTKSMLVQLTIGSTFDPFDLAAYAAGVILIAAVDSLLIS